jgi:DNA-binding response OmpR family regulator
MVDDDPAILGVVGRMLVQHGYAAVTAQTGPEALARAASEHPAAILLDLNLALPEMDSWELLRALKDNAATRDVPVVVLSELDRVRDMADRVLTRRAGPGRILIVEDDQDLARVLRESFTQHRIQTDHASTGERAIALSQEIEPDLLLLDLALAEGDGYQVVDWFRQHDRLRHVPLVVYTARDLTSAERQRLQLGPTEFLTKARISPEEVQRRVLGLLTRVAPTGERRAA